jgi:hypothetical protein
VRAIAKGFIGGVATPAEANGCPSGKAEGLPFGIHNFEITLHADGTVVIDRNFRRRHFFS